MRTVTVARYIVPSETPPGRWIKSAVLMTPEEAAARGAREMVPGSQVVRDLPDTPAEALRIGAWPSGAGPR